MSQLLRDTCYVNFFEFQTIYTCMSERDPQKHWVWGSHNENEEFNLNYC